jgi:hypothetical protein
VVVACYNFPPSFLTPHNFQVFILIDPPPQQRKRNKIQKGDDGRNRRKGRNTREGRDSEGRREGRRRKGKEGRKWGEEGRK